MKISIAGINIDVQGAVYDYFKYRVRNYIIPDDSCCSVKILCEENNSIPIPQCNVIKKENFRIYGETADCYYQYDILKENECSAIIASDKSWTNIKCSLMDVEDLGGASLNIRQFNMIGFVIKYIMLNSYGMSLHSSSLSYKNNGVMFSADSGTGKSTHTRLWKKVFDDVIIVNDDMPVIKKVNDIWHLFGCPWSGKSEINTNVSVPLKALVFLERGSVNEIERIYAPDCVLRIIKQTFLPAYKELAGKVMGNISKLVEDVPIYRLRCTISDEAPKVVKKELNLL